MLPDVVFLANKDNHKRQSIIKVKQVKTDRSTISQQRLKQMRLNLKNFEDS